MSPDFTNKKGRGAVNAATHNTNKEVAVAANTIMPADEAVMHELPTFAWESIGPEEARALLATNQHNRNVRQRRVDQYARDMRAGRWLPAGEPIQIAPDGTLHNGQHRMLAVVAAGVNVTLPVMRNVPFEFQAIADQGLRRRFADVLKLQYGESNITHLAATVKRVHIYRRTGRIGAAEAVVPTIAELTDTYLAEPNIKNSLSPGRLLEESDVYTPRSVGSALHYLFFEADPENADAYFHAVITGESLAPGDPILALRRNLRMERLRKPSPMFVAALHVKAFNAWREGRQMARVRWVPSGPRAEAFPRILTAEEITGEA